MITSQPTKENIENSLKCNYLFSTYFQSSEQRPIDKV
nr:MAG TPA_asm: hypothetical protein [Caudoviricetes sp.]